MTSSSGPFLIPFNQIKLEIKEEIEIEEESFTTIEEEVVIKQELPSYQDDLETNIDIKKEEINENRCIILDRSVPLSLQRVKRERRIKEPPVIFWNTSKRKNPVAFVKREKARFLVIRKTLPKPREKIVFYCDYCGKAYKLKMRLTNHMKSHFKKNKKKKKEKRRKLETVETEDYECDLCGAKYSCLYYLRGHLMKHLRPKSHFCCICEMIFYSKSDLEDHLASHKNEDNRKENRLTSNGKGHHHVKEKIIKIKRERLIHFYECEICGKTFKKNSHFKQHLYVHSQERPFKCEICSKGFKSPGEVVKHSIIHSTIKPHSCLQCEKTFKTKNEVVLHSRVHSDERLFKCSFPNCKSRFKAKTDLKKHYIVHLPKQFKCSICEKKLRNLKSLKLHEDMHITNPSKFIIKFPKNKLQSECEICHKMLSKINYYRHIKTVHLDPSDRPFTCDLCGKSYKSKDEIKKHLVVHFEDRKFPCKICGFSFKRGFHLLAHLRLHEKGKLQNQKKKGDEVGKKIN